MEHKETNEALDRAKEIIDNLYKQIEETRKELEKQGVETGYLFSMHFGIGQDKRAISVSNGAMAGVLAALVNLVKGNKVIKEMFELLFNYLVKEGDINVYSEPEKGVSKINIPNKYKS